jgi:hypothetical protein
MLAMLEVMMGVSYEFPEQVNIINLTSIEQAEQVSGIDLLAPTVLPEGFIFSHAAYEPRAGHVVLFVQPQEGTRASADTQLLVFERRLADQTPYNWDGYPSSAVEAVLVGDSPATYVRGGVVDGEYAAESARRYQVWTIGDLSLEIIIFTPEYTPIRLEKDDLIAIAESMQ